MPASSPEYDFLHERLSRQLRRASIARRAKWLKFWSVIATIAYFIEGRHRP